MGLSFAALAPAQPVGLFPIASPVPTIQSAGSLLRLPTAAEAFPQAVGEPSATALPEALSPSSVNTFVHDCQVKWFYRKVMGYAETRGAALGLGTAVDAALCGNFEQKIETRKDLPVDGAVDLFRDAWTRELDTIALDRDDDAGELRDCGEVMTRVYMEQAAPRIQPAKVQSYVCGRIGDVPVHGYADVIDDRGRVIDIKTSKKKPHGVSASHLIQISTYAILDPAATGEARIDTLTKTKTVSLNQQTVKIGVDEKVQTARLYSIARDAMESGLYVPNRGSMLCSRKYCSFSDQCEADYGGRIQ